MSAVKIDVTDTLSVPLQRLIDALEGQGRVELHAAMGHAVQFLTTEHLKAIATTRHATAERLGGTPTGYWADAAEKVGAPEALAAFETVAILSIPHPGVARAFHDVTIVPVNASALAIPIHAIAYGHRAAELWDALTLFIPKGSNIIAMHDAGGGILPLFALCRSITQEQDRTLLPSDEAWFEAAKDAAEEYLAEATQAGGRL